MSHWTSLHVEWVFVGVCVDLVTEWCMDRGTLSQSDFVLVVGGVRGRVVATKGSSTPCRVSWGG